MPDTAVTNASPIIYLARANLFELLHLAAPEVLVPVAVADEILVRGGGDPGARALSDTPWIRTDAETHKRIVGVPAQYDC